MLFLSSAPIIIFAGPSIKTIPEQYYSNMLIYPPIKAGDLEPLLKLTPGICVIIDGLFGKNRAIAPFECIDLINLGWRLIGASSIGALRAADLYTMGMIGIGEIYNMYRLGTCTSDADVAVVYDTSGTHTKELTISIVHIMSLLQWLEDSALIDQIKSRKLLHKARQIIWFERTLEYLLNEWTVILDSDINLVNKIRIMFEAQTLDPKKLDALEVFKYLNAKRWYTRNL
jgi:hypothetical protein